MPLKVTMQITEQLSRQAYSEHYKKFKTKHFAKGVPECMHATSNFRGREGFVELGHFYKPFVKNKKKRSYREAFWSFFF